jgi:hypothetical protein
MLFWAVLNTTSKSRGMRFSMYPSVSSLSHCQHPPPEWCICNNWWTYTDTSV